MGRLNRADALQNDKRAGTVGFALTMLQRRLGSSPEAIFQSLRRRRERLEKRLRAEELLRRGAQVAFAGADSLPALTPEDIEDLEDAPDAEQEVITEQIVDQATAARRRGLCRRQTHGPPGHGVDQRMTPMHVELSSPGGSRWS
jgi:hypothetical protein